MNFMEKKIKFFIDRKLRKGLVDFFFFEVKIDCFKYLWKWVFLNKYRLCYYVYYKRKEFEMSVFNCLIIFVEG